MSLLDRITSGRPKATDKITLAFDPSDGRRLAEATLRRDNLRAMAEYRNKAADSPDIVEAEADVQAIIDGLETFTITLQGIGPARVRELIVAHPPTKEQIKAANIGNNGNPAARLQWNEDTFPPELLSEMVIRIEASSGDEEPITDLSLEDATRLWKSGWSSGDKNRLINTALSLDQNENLVEDVGKD